VPAAPTLAALLTALTRDPGRPRLTWYGDGGERVELSGAVLDNWVSKTANLLVEELDAGPGTRVLLDLPAHWRTVVWALAVWRVGACVVLPGASGTPADVVVTDRPQAHAGARDLLAVALPALARRVDDLPPGALDAAASVMTYADVVGWAPATDPSRPALVDAAGATSHAALLAAAAATAQTAGLDGTTRGLLTAVPDDPGTVLRAVLSLLAAGGSAVLVVPGRDATARERIVSTERVTVDLDG